MRELSTISELLKIEKKEVTSDLTKHTKRELMMSTDFKIIEGLHQDSVGNSVFYLVQNVMKKVTLKHKFYIFRKYVKEW